MSSELTESSGNILNIGGESKNSLVPLVPADVRATARSLFSPNHHNPTRPVPRHRHSRAADPRATSAHPPRATPPPSPPSQVKGVARPASPPRQVPSSPDPPTAGRRQRVVRRGAAKTLSREGTPSPPYNLAALAGVCACWCVACACDVDCRVISTRTSALQFRRARGLDIA